VAPHAPVPPQERKAARLTLASAHLAVAPAVAAKEVASAAKTKPVRLVWEPRAVPLSPALLTRPKPTSLPPQAPPGSEQRPSRASTFPVGSASVAALAAPASRPAPRMNIGRRARPLSPRPAASL